MSDRQAKVEPSLLSGLVSSYQAGRAERDQRLREMRDHIWTRLTAGARVRAARGHAEAYLGVAMAQLRVDAIDPDELTLKLEARAASEGLSLERDDDAPLDLYRVRLYGWAK